MSTKAEVSNDKSSWTPYERSRTKIEDYKYIRTIETVEHNWSRAQIESWLITQIRGSRSIEYSMDNGNSYQPFRWGSPNDAARVFTVVQNNKYIVRSVMLAENQSYVAPPNPKATAFLNAAYNPETSPAALTKPARVKHDYRWVTIRDGAYNIEKNPPGSYACKIEIDIPMSLQAPNVNNVSVGDQYDNTNASRGHVYVVEPCTHLSINWQNVISAHLKKSPIYPDEYAWVESARAYDSDTVTMTNGVFAMSVLSDKYYVNNSGAQAAKIGTRWLIFRSHIQSFCDAINSNNGYAVYNENSHTIERDSPQEKDLVGAIMSAKTELQSAIDTRDPERLAQALFEGSQFRDKAVDELREFTLVLSKARQLALEIIVEDSNGHSA